LTFGDTIKDLHGIPIPQVYVENVGFVALKGAPANAADGSSNTSTAAAMTIEGPPGSDPYQVTVFAPGYLRAALEPTQLFQDGFDTSTLDITNRWKTPSSGGGGVAATNALTNTVLGTGTTANGWSYLESATTFPPTNPGWLMFYTGINIAFPIVANQYFFWGLGTSPATPTAAAPLTNACGFEVTTAGKMFAVTYQSGTRVVVQDLSTSTGNSKQPQDSATHKYFLYYKGDNIYWCIDNQDSVVASTTTGAPGPDVNILPIKFTAIAGSVAPVSSGLLQVNTVTVADTAKNSIQISDANNPWRQVTVSPGGSMQTSPSNDGAQPTYSAASTALAQITTPGAFFVLQGSATKTIRLLRCHVSGTASAGITLDITLAKWSAAPSGGTLGTAPTIAPHDSTNAAATAVASTYTVGPTAGTLVGVMRTTKLYCNVPTAINGPDIEWEFGVRPGQAGVLRGTTQYFAILTNVIPGAGGSFDVYMEFTEGI
jgi:hypothetical protein